MARSSSGRRLGGGLLDLAVAALAGGSVAFATFAMPDGLFAQIVVASRLPDLLAAAQPPLGDTARWTATAAAGAITFLLAWALLRALDRVPTRRRPPAEAGFAEPFAELPRVRRADAHPDAPARRPLRAGRELGEPLEGPPPADDMLDLVDPVPEERFADLIPQPLPGFLVPQNDEPAPEADDRPAETDDGLEALSAQLPEAVGDGGGRTIGDLMARLETGLSRRERGRPEAPAAPQAAAAPVETPPAAPIPPKPSRTPLDLSPPPAAAADDPPPAEDRVGHRLRSAINDLQKLSGHG
jgi:hypothetical protein